QITVLGIRDALVERQVLDHEATHSVEAGARSPMPVCEDKATSGRRCGRRRSGVHALPSGEPVVEASKSRLEGSSPLQVLTLIPRQVANSCLRYQHLVDNLGIWPQRCGKLRKRSEFPGASWRSWGRWTTSTRR